MAEVCQIAMQTLPHHLDDPQESRVIQYSAGRKVLQVADEAPVQLVDQDQEEDHLLIQEPSLLHSVSLQQPQGLCRVGSKLQTALVKA